MKFDVRDLDQKTLYERAYSEAREIYTNAHQSKGRTLKELLINSMYGLAAEVYMIEKMCYYNNSERYQDIISPSGIKIEIKVTSALNFVPYVIARLNNDKGIAYRNLPEWTFVFINDKKNYTYELEGTYRWNHDLDTFEKKPWNFEDEQFIIDRLTGDKTFLENYQ